MRVRSSFRGEVHDAILIHVAGKIRDVNQRACEMLGYDKDEFLAMEIKDLHPQKNHKESKERVSTAKTGKPLQFETQFLKSDGTILDVEVRVIGSVMSRQERVRILSSFLQKMRG